MSSWGLGQLELCRVAVWGHRSAIGGPDLAGFFPDAQGIEIVNPFQLSWQEPGALGKNVFGADRCRWVPLGAVRCLNREIVAAAIGTDRHHRDWRSGTDRHLRIQ